MKRGSQESTATVYAYGCLAPTAGEDFARAEMILQRAMWDRLVLADRIAERAQEDAARADPAIGPLLARVDTLSDQIGAAVKARKAARAAERRKVDTPDIDAQITALCDERRALRKDLWPLLGAWRKANKETLTAIEIARRAAASEARKGSGCYWGNSDRVLESFDRGRKLAFKRRGRMRWSDPLDPGGVLTSRIMRTPTGLGASMADAMSGRYDALKIGPVDPRAFAPETSWGERHRLVRTWVEMRVDAAGRCIRLPLMLHRLPGPDERIKSAQLTWYKEGESLRWQLALTCTRARVTLPAHPSPRAAGIDVGWRLQPDGSLLVATLYDGHRMDRFTLPADWMAGQDQVGRLSSHIDEGLLALAAARNDSVHELPDDLRMPLMGWRPNLGARHVDAQALHDAVQSRIAAVKGTAARADVPADIRAWYDRYRHLSVWRDDLRAKLQRRRQDLYRNLAASIVDRYAVLGLEDLDLADMARTKTRSPEDPDNPLALAARANRVRAAIYSLMLVLRQQAAKVGTEVVTVTGPTTMHCHQCGSETGQPDRAQRIWTCQHCGSVWDQDENAARVIFEAITMGECGRVVAKAA